jgi:hypothetical protein
MYRESSEEEIVLTTWTDTSRREAKWRASTGPFMTAGELVDAAQDLSARIQAGDIEPDSQVYVAQTNTSSGSGSSYPWLMALEVIQVQETDHAYPENNEE